MAVASQNGDFEIWLKKKLIDLNTDDEVFTPYITGIFESEESPEEKKEALEGILSEIFDTGIEELCSEIFLKWTSVQEKQLEKDNIDTTIDLDAKFTVLMQVKKLECNTAINKASTEQQKLKEAILSQYSQVSDGEETDEELEVASAGSRNSNVKAVIQAERDKRTQDKEASQKKKEKDKEDRAKQKTKNEDRKEKEKKRTQKGEKRR